MATVRHRLLQRMAGTIMDTMVATIPVRTVVSESGLRKSVFG
jgi:hypothetical protein